MQITITPEAENWFIEELELQPGDSVRFFGKYGGKTNVHAGFSTGVEVATPSQETYAALTQNDITYFIEPTDEWFFANHDLMVGFDDYLKEPNYSFSEIK